MLICLSKLPVGMDAYYDYNHHTAEDYDSSNNGSQIAKHVYHKFSPITPWQPLNRECRAACGFDPYPCHGYIADDVNGVCYFTNEKVDSEILPMSELEHSFTWHRWKGEPKPDTQHISEHY